MKVTMKVQVSGTRNGEDWPAPGQVVDLPDAEAVSLINQGMAVPVEEIPAESATDKSSRAKA